MSPRFYHFSAFEAAEIPPNRFGPTTRWEPCILGTRAPELHQSGKAPTGKPRESSGQGNESCVSDDSRGLQQEMKRTNLVCDRRSTTEHMLQGYYRLCKHTLGEKLVRNNRQNIHATKNYHCTNNEINASKMNLVEVSEVSKATTKLHKIV